jgi:WD40 repeat protein
MTRQRTNLGGTREARLSRALPSRALRAGATLLAAVAGLGWVGAAEPVTYDDHVLPVLRNACLNCHNADKKKADFDASSYDALLAGGGSGKAVVAGDVAGSLLWRLVTHAEEPHMPPKGSKLGDGDLATVRRWIEGGLLEGKGSKAAAVPRPASEVAFRPVGRGRPEGDPPMPGTSFAGEPAAPAARAGAIAAVAASPWAPLVAVAGQKQVLLYHADKGSLEGALPFPEGFPYVLQFSASGRLLMVGGGVGAKRGVVGLHDVVTGRRVATLGDELDSVLAADLAPDQSRVALGGALRVVRVLDVGTGAVLQTIRKHTDWVTAIAYSPDGVLLATADRAGGLHLWEAGTGNPYGELRMTNPRRISALSWRDDSNLLAAASEDGQVWLWEAETLSMARKWMAHPGGVESVRFSHDGHLATVGRDKKACWWDASGKKLHDLGALPDIGLAVAVTDDPPRVVVGDYSGVVRMWDVRDGKARGDLDANPPASAHQRGAVAAHAGPRVGQEEAKGAGRDASESKPSTPPKPKP